MTRARAYDATLEVRVAHAFTHLTFIDNGNAPKLDCTWDRMIDRELRLDVGNVIGLSLTSDSDEGVSSDARSHYIVTNVERVMRLHPTGDTLVQFITLEECAPPMSASDAPIDQPATKD